VALTITVCLGVVADAVRASSSRDAGGSHNLTMRNFNFQFNHDRQKCTMLEQCQNYDNCLHDTKNSENMVSFLAFRILN
jgi:hypothetical protein